MRMIGRHTKAHARMHTRTSAGMHCNIYWYTDAHAPNILIYPYTNTRTHIHTLKDAQQ